jgi:hypothetical protein
MGATSVTGVGPGSAESVSKGAAGRMTLSNSHLIGPHVVACGNGTLDGSGDLSVVLAGDIGGVAADYAVFATDTTVAAATACAASLAVSSGVWTLTLKGTASQTVSWMVVKTGSNL